MPVELNIVESVTELDTTVVTVNLVSASEPGPAGPGVPTGGTVGQVLTKDSGTDYDTSWQDATGGGGGGVTDADYLVGTAHAGLSAEIVVGTSPGGELGGTWASPTVDATHSGSSHASVQAAAEATAAADLDAHEADTTNIHGIADTSALALTANVQPLDSDLTAIAALTTTSFGRGLLELANAAALLSAAGAAAATHAHAGEDITSGTVADARIASTIARDSEVTSAIAALSTVYQPLDSDLTSIAALTTTAFGRSLLELADAAATRALLDLEAGTDFPSLTTFNDHSARHEDGGSDEISLTGLSGAPADTVNKSLYDANTVLAADSDNTPAAVTMGASTILARLAAGNIKAASVSEIRTLLDVPTNAEAILDTLFAAKGDLITATANDTPAILTVGTDGHVLTADSGQAAGIKWAAAAGGGTGSVLLAPGAATLPDGSSGNAAPALTRSQGTESNPKKHYLILQFDGAGSTTEHAWWDFIVPADYASGGTLDIYWEANATSNAVKWQARVGAITPDDTDTPLEHASAAAATVTTNVNTTEARRLTKSTITLTMDSAAAGDLLILTIFRDPSDGSDTSTADANLIYAVFKYTK